MTDERRSERAPELSDLSPADAAIAARIRDFGDTAVRPFDAVGIATLATAGSGAGLGRLRGSLRFGGVSVRSVWIVVYLLLVVALTTIVVVAVGSTGPGPSVILKTAPPTTIPSQLAVRPPESVAPSPSEASAAVLAPGRITYSVNGDVYVGDIGGGAPRKILTGGTKPYDDPRWSADGRISITRFTGDDQTSALDVDLTDASGAHARVVGHVVPGEGKGYERWSPDGTRLAILDRSAITIIGRGAPVTLSPPAGENWDVSDVMTFSWSPDATSLLAGLCRPENGLCSKSTSIRTVLVPVAGSAPRELAPADHPAWGAGFSPDGSRIAFAISTADGFQLEVMDADGTNRRVVVPPVGTGTWTYDLTYRWSPDGRTIAFHHSVDDGSGATSAGKGLWVKDVDSDAPARTVSSDIAVFDIRAWSPDGQWILADSFGGDSSHLSAIDVGTGLERVLASGTQDGDWIWDAP